MPVMQTRERLQAEQTFHDRQAAERASRFADTASLRFSDDWYLYHASWIRPAMSRLGDVAGKSILDFGCGHGMAAVVLARRGARVTAMDLSAGYLAEACRRAGANERDIDFVQANGERLPFADGSFDGIWGNAILHHLDLAVTARELRRVLRPGGAAVFCEPWGGNPLVAFARRVLPYPGKHRTADEHPFRAQDLAALRDVFPALRLEGFQLPGMLRRVLQIEGTAERLERWDARLLTRIPALWRLCRYVVLTLS
jgi:ubiquinone/menaquinone biosynthesis C-methylase UbiE